MSEFQYFERIGMPWMPIPIRMWQKNADPTRSGSGSTTLHNSTTNHCYDKHFVLYNERVETRALVRKAKKYKYSAGRVHADVAALHLLRVSAAPRSPVLCRLSPGTVHLHFYVSSPDILIAIRIQPFCWIESESRSGSSLFVESNPNILISVRIQSFCWI